MALFDPADPLRRMSAVLERERRAILDGRLDRLGELAREKERATAALARAAGNVKEAERLRALRELAGRNAALLRASAEAIRAVQAKLEAGRNEDGNLVTYDRRGRKREPLGAHGKWTSRA